jgi:hypothetical protein
MTFQKSRMFLMQLGQEMDRDNRTRADALLRDTEGFLGLTKNALRSLLRVDYNLSYKDEFRDRILAICLDKYRGVRANLVEIGMKFLIEEFFLKSPRVVVLDRDYFLGRIRQWRVDPCETNDE